MFFFGGVGFSPAKLKSILKSSVKTASVVSTSLEWGRLGTDTMLVPVWVGWYWVVLQDGFITKMVLQQC